MRFVNLIYIIIYSNICISHCFRHDNYTSIDKLVSKSMDGQFPGDDRLKKNGKPIFTQRTCFLYYNRVEAGRKFIWATIAMGRSNALEMFADKKKSIERWMVLNSTGFENLRRYIPRIWTTEKSFHKDFNSRDVYVYKPSDGSAGHGIKFQSGIKTMRDIKELERRGDRKWLIQEFIPPFLYENRKTHFRVLSLIIVQQDGSRQAYVYKKMRMFVAKDEFDEKRMYNIKDDNTLMFMTNINITYQRFLMDGDNKDKVFPWQKYMYDVENELGEEKYEMIYSKMRELHSVLYETIGDHVECKKTDVSVYDNACYHIIGSDISLDNHGEPHLIETNTAMAIKHIWSKQEIMEISRGTGSLINLPDSPYKKDVRHQAWTRVF